MVEGQRPNIVVVLGHDAGRQFTPCGISNVATPNAGRLAADGVLFENAFCASPSTSPASAALFSGRYPHSVGMLGPAAAWTGFRFSSQAMHAAGYFKALEYETMLLGAAPEIGGPDCPDAHYDGIGFDMRGAAARPLLANDLPAELPAMLDGRRKSRKPFYLQIAIAETGFDRLDEGLGHVMKILDQRAMTGNTVLVFTTDRGAPVAEAEPTLYDRDIGVAFIMRYPGCFAPARRFPCLASHVDVLPTLMEAAGCMPPEAMDGSGLFALLTGKRAAPRECIFAELNFNRDYIPKRCVRTERYKYIFNFAGTGNHFDELYDLQSDPEEAHNLSRSFSDLYDALGRPFGTKNLTGYPGDISAACLYGGAAEPAMEELRHKLAADLVQWMADTNDPLLDGPVASPRFYEKIAWLKEQKELAQNA